jgi:hypothetical protein
MFSKYVRIRIKVSVVFILFSPQSECVDKFYCKSQIRDFAKIRLLGLAVFMRTDMTRDNAVYSILEYAVMFLFSSQFRPAVTPTVWINRQVQVSAGAPVTPTTLLSSSLQPVLSNTRDLSPHITAKFSALPHRILEVIFSSLVYRKWGISWFSLAPQSTYQDSISN